MKTELQAQRTQGGQKWLLEDNATDTVLLHMAQTAERFTTKRNGFSEPGAILIVL